MKRTKTQIRQNAALAKSRLATGFWNQTHKRANLENINNANCEEEQIYRRVVTCMTEGQSPLSNILDQAHMQTLDDTARQRYVLNMSNLVQKSIERYNKVC